MLCLGVLRRSSSSVNKPWMKKMELIMRRNTLTVLKKSNLYFQLIKIKVLRLWVLESPVQTDTPLLANNSQHCWMLHVPPFGHPVACCCVLLRVVTQSLKPVEPLAMCKRDATTLNIVWPTILRVVASACTQSKRLSELFRAWNNLYIH